MTFPFLSHKMLDIKVCQSITSLIEKLSTSGKQQIDTKTFKELASLAGQSEEYLKLCLERIFQHLEQRHCEIRFGAFLIVEELFRRSKCFRELLLDDFRTFLELTVESDVSKALPPPFNVAKKLKQRVLQAIHKWYSTFGDEHKRLSLSYNFLKHNLKVDFEDALKRNANELHRERVEQQRQDTVVAKKVESIESEMNENVDEISRIVTEMNNCFCLLIPKPEELFSQDSNSINDNDTPSSTQEVDYREHGIHCPTNSISIHLNQQFGLIERTEDNSVIIDNLKDFYLLLKNRYALMIKKWIQISSKAGNQILFRKIMDIKKLVDGEMDRFNQLKLVNSSNENEDSSESDSDFEEVVPEKEGYEADVFSQSIDFPSTSSASEENPTKRKRDSECWTTWGLKGSDEKDPTSLLATLNKLEENSTISKTNLFSNSTSKILQQTTSVSANKSSQKQNTLQLSNDKDKGSRKRKLLKIAPRLPYDIDLYHWEDKDKDLTVPSFEIVETDGHKFWTPAMDREGEIIEDPAGIASLRTRVIEFSGKFEPVKWSCRTPLPSGNLCPRKDRLKCPLHGKIIARDEIGNPTNPQDIAELEKEQEKIAQSKPPDWQDPEFLKDIQAEIGIDLTITSKKTMIRKKKTFAEMYPNLIDIEKKNNTPRTRLEKKVFNKSAIKRVAQTLDGLNYKRYKDKFGDQWNYAMHDG